MEYSAKRRWKSIGNAIEAVHLFKESGIANVVSNIDELIDEIVHCPESNASSTFISGNPSYEAILEHKRRESLFEHIRRGSKSDLDAIEKLVYNDPKKFLVNPTSELSFLNKRNVVGRTPLYEAALNGYPNVIRCLIEFGANPLIKSEVGDNEMESCLEVACRWGNIKAVEVLLNFGKWKKQDISKARKLTCNREIKLMLADYSRRISNYSSCC
ncbi:unnamed protein product [Blepharisma stoltei]|uniref:Ankyrin repeat protein n=1 Tax=Blepharisma stoltei TaxID=1481888 RepID=A0AAU9JLK4_9CILI|nr:unnamed protein product [Blepharisma stoltei]